MPIYGHQSKLSIVYQNSYDTVGDVTNSATYLPFLSETLTTNLEDILSEQIEGVYDEKERYRGKHHVSGDIEFEVGAKSIGKFLASMMPKSTTVQSSTIYRHDFIPRTSQWGSKSWNLPVTISKTGDGTSGIQNLFNLNATGIEFSLEKGGFLTGKLNLVGGVNAGGSSTGADSYYASDELYTWDASSLAIGGAGVSPTSISITLNEPIEPSFTLTESYWPRSNNSTGFRDVTFQMSLPWNNNSDYTYFFNDTKTSEMTLYCEGKTEIQSGYYNYIKFSLWDIMYETCEENASGAGEVELTISGRAQYNETEGKACQINILNLEDGGQY